MSTYEIKWPEEGTWQPPFELVKEVLSWVSANEDTCGKNRDKHTITFLDPASKPAQHLRLKAFDQKVERRGIVMGSWESRMFGGQPDHWHAAILWDIEKHSSEMVEV